MPKINVYLPEELAAAVRAADFPVSPVCQQALANAVRTVTVARKVIKALHDPQFDPNRFPGIGRRIADRMTPRLKRALDLARDVAGAGERVGTGQMLLGILEEGDNLALRVLEALDVDLDELRAAAEQTGSEQTGAPEPGTSEADADSAPAGSGSGHEDAGGEPSLWMDLTLPARKVIAAALEASIGFGHNYIGCEHLLLGLLAEPDAVAGRMLHQRGVEPAGARRAVTAALTGFVHARQAGAQEGTDKIDEITRRLDALESRIGSLGA